MCGKEVFFGRSLGEECLRKVFWEESCREIIAQTVVEKCWRSVWWRDMSGKRVVYREIRGKSV